ncbi:MAG: 4-(cytidine 5'-diphospho)-2-C-methyl-D-erythritol kinase [Cytophagales bacterium]|nr:MAG: 4-(cytidine 5'-diphospho)-2-C-methyl-D-erythritol kinase [Cytophagales bacterium]
MIVFPNAKINLGLQIIKKRSDGYHEINTCFYPIGLTDVLEILPHKEETTFTQTGIDIPADNQPNICMKAYKLLQKYFKLPPLQIHLHKNIPVGAGLGGGSADAAYMLKALNEMFFLELSAEDLWHFAKELGSDCAFFLQNTPAIGKGRGEELTPFQVSIAHYALLIIYPNLHISTAEAYQKVVPNTPKMPLEQALQMPLKAWENHLINDFEKPLFEKYPLLQSIKEQLYQAGALYAAMSGSGSTLFGIFEPQKLLNLEWQIPQDYFVWQSQINI